MRTTMKFQLIPRMSVTIPILAQNNTLSNVHTNTLYICLSSAIQWFPRIEREVNARAYSLTTLIKHPTKM